MLSLFQGKGRRAFGLCALFACLLVAQTPEQAEQSRRAKELMSAGRFSEAIPLYDQLVRAVPGNTGLIANLGMALHMAERDSEAVEQLARVLKVQPGAYPALMMSGVSYMRLGEPAKATPLFERAVKLQPSDMEARSMLSDALLMLGRHEAAIPHLRAVAAANPQNPKVWFGLGRSHEMVAQAAYQRMLKLYPESPYTIAVTAEARLKQGRLNSALELFKRAGDVPGVHAGLAEVYEKTGKPALAAEERAKEKKLVPATAGAGGLFAKVRANNQAALDAFRKLISLPASPELNEVLAELHRNQGRYRESIAAWEEAIRLAPNDPRLRFELATTVYMSRDYALAEKLLREMKPETPEVLFMLGDSVLNQQRAAEAIPILEQAVKGDPQSLYAHASLARSYVQNGDMQKAIPHLEQSLSVDEDGALHYQLARAYQSAGRTEEAKKLLARYQELQAESH